MKSGADSYSRRVNQPARGVRGAAFAARGASRQVRPSGVILVSLEPRPSKSREAWRWPHLAWWTCSCVYRCGNFCKKKKNRTWSLRFKAEHNNIGIILDRWWKGSWSFSNCGRHRAHRVTVAHQERFFFFFMTKKVKTPFLQTLYAAVNKLAESVTVALGIQMWMFRGVRSHSDLVSSPVLFLPWAPGICDH